MSTTPAQLDPAAADHFRSPVAELFFLAAPTVAQMASYTLMQFVDTWMLARVGVNPTTAAGNAGLLAFGFLSLGIGTMHVVNTLVSQAYGRKDYASCGRNLWQGVWVSLGYAALMLAVAPLLGRVFTAMGHEPVLAGMEADYLRIALSFAVIKLIQTAVAQFLLATDRPNAVLLAAVVGMSANCLAAWVLIFGHLGFGPMGVIGAAWAQNIGVSVELLVTAAFALGTGRRLYGMANWRPHAAGIGTLLRLGVPAGLQLAADVFAWSVFSLWITGFYGTPAMAATMVMFRFMSVSFMPAFGLATAVTALVGRYIGRGQPEEGVHRAWLAFKIAAAYMLVCGAFFFLARQHVIGWFLDDPEVQRIGAILLVFTAIYQLFDAMFIIYNGALRGAGDTLAPAMMTMGLNWSLTVGGGWLMARFVPQLGIVGPWIPATLYGLLLGSWMMWRFHRRGWMRIHLEDSPGEPGAASPEPAASDTLPGLQTAANVPLDR